MRSVASEPLTDTGSSEKNASLYNERLAVSRAFRPFRQIYDQLGAPWTGLRADSGTG